MSFIGVFKNMQKIISDTPAQYANIIHQNHTAVLQVS